MKSLDTKGRWIIPEHKVKVYAFLFAIAVSLAFFPWKIVFLIAYLCIGVYMIREKPEELRTGKEDNTHV